MVILLDSTVSIINRWKVKKQHASFPFTNGWPTKTSSVNPYIKTNLMKKKTLGERRVRIDFNVLGSETVDQIKRKTAELIDLVNSVDVPTKTTQDAGELNRLKALAMTDLELAGMLGVKAATFKPEEE
jgi:hypothetical protein